MERGIFSRAGFFGWAPSPSAAEDAAAAAAAGVVDDDEASADGSACAMAFISVCFCRTSDVSSCASCSAAITANALATMTISELIDCIALATMTISELVDCIAVALIGPLAAKAPCT